MGMGPCSWMEDETAAGNSVAPQMGYEPVPSAVYQQQMSAGSCTHLSMRWHALLLVTSCVEHIKQKVMHAGVFKHE
ncbi:hypothetical protein TNCT_447091, partial [Trichonephila clavata]